MLTNTNKTVEEYTADADKQQKDATDSLERCQEDGFVSQLCSRLSSDLSRTKARLAAQDWKDECWGLFDLEGRRVRAKLYQGQWGLCWAFCDAKNKFTGKFISARPRREATMEKKGYREAKEMAPVDARHAGSGYGFSGLSTVHIEVYRTDDGYPSDAVVA